MKPNNHQFNVLKSMAVTGIEKSEKLLQQWFSTSVTLNNIEVVLQFQQTELFHLLPHEHGEYTEHDEYTVIEVEFSRPIHATGYAILSVQNALQLVAAFHQKFDPNPPIDEVFPTTLTETGLILLKGIMGSITNAMKSKMAMSAPRFSTGNRRESVFFHPAFQNSTVLFISWDYIMAETLLRGAVCFPFDTNAMQSILKMIDTVS